MSVENLYYKGFYPIYIPINNKDVKFGKILCTN